MVRPVVTEPEPPRVGAGGPPDDLVAEADPEERPAVRDRGAGEGNRSIEPGRIARSG